MSGRVVTVDLVDPMGKCPLQQMNTEEDHHCALTDSLCDCPGYSLKWRPPADCPLRSGDVVIRAK